MKSVLATSPLFLRRLLRAKLLDSFAYMNFSRESVFNGASHPLNVVLLIGNLI